MSVRTLEESFGSASNAPFEVLVRRSSASYERELKQRAGTECTLRGQIAADQILLQQKELLIEQLEMLGKESDHRLLNGLQLIASLIALQSRAASNAETASQLASAAERVGMIVRVHRRLHDHDGSQSVAFKTYLDGLCSDFSAMLALDEKAGQAIACECADVELPTVTAIPLGYIVSELITNAAKYGKGPITVRLAPEPGKGHALSVASRGQSLPKDFDPARSKGLGMRIIRSFVAKVGGELRIDHDTPDEVRFTVLFP